MGRDNMSLELSWNLLAAVKNQPGNAA
jgi:hypothetical protein